MDTTRPTERPSRLAWMAMALEGFLGIGAILGGLALIIGPRGEIIPLPASALSGSPFETYLLPGVVLFGVVGLGSLAAMVVTWRGYRMAPLAAVAVGVGLQIWLDVEILVIGYTSDPPLQLFYLVLSAVITAVGVAWCATRWPIGPTVSEGDQP